MKIDETDTDTRPIPQPGARIVSIDRQPEYNGRTGTILAVSDRENRGKTERRIHVKWDLGRNKTWLALSAQGKRWMLA